MSPLLFNAQHAQGSTSLVPTPDMETGLPLLRLPKGFSYRSMSWTGDALAAGGTVPDRHDGMAIVPGAEPTEQVLLRNHERYNGIPIRGEDVPVYDDFEVPAALRPFFGGRLEVAGGVSGIVLRDGMYHHTELLLGGTMINCAGGLSPWDTWLTCEEIVFRGSNIALPGDVTGKDHGYVFEVPPSHLGPASAVPIKDMGFFRHEAVAFDRQTGNAYLTEDNGPNSGFFRFEPNEPLGGIGSLEKGGKLSMLRVKGSPNADLRRTEQGKAFKVDWVPVEDPDSDPEVLNSYGAGLTNLVGQGRSGPYLEGEAQGGARFDRGEGIWEYDNKIYWVDTTGGPAQTGSVWLYDPQGERMLCLFASESEEHADAIDNIALSPTNGLIAMCEDGGGVNNADNSLKYGCRLLLARQPGDKVLTFAENNMDLSGGVPNRPEIPTEDYRRGEWAGAVFSADGQTLYANLQSPGVTVAITGPWNSL